MAKIRRAEKNDESFLKNLEEKCFPASRQASSSSLKRSMSSHHQSVLILETDEDVPVGSAVVFKFKKTWRIYSISILPEFQRLGLGRFIMEKIIEKAKECGVHRISLEADHSNKKLIAWYKGFGLSKVKILKNFYAEGEDAEKMSLQLKSEASEKEYLANIAVVDHEYPWLKQIPNLEVVNIHQFLNDEKYQNAKDLRVFNLCSSLGYQTLGYYVSLLATAREFRPIPTVATLEDALDQTITESIGEEVFDAIQEAFKQNSKKEVTFRIFFGQSHPPRYQKLAKTILRLFEAPLLEVTFIKERVWKLKKIRILTLNDIIVDEGTIKDAKKYFSHNRFAISKIKQYKFDLAILVDPKEPAAPSGKTALDKFIDAAKKVGFYVEFITKEDYSRIPQFDALFIRATTNVDDYTYQFSRYAYSEGLAVIDDPWSILKCANKLYFHECMRSHSLPTPKTLIVSTSTPVEKLLSTFSFPIILKRPDSSSSLGVYKVTDEKELKLRMKDLFHKSALIIAQEYIPSAFDWRIGILEGKPLYACKYFMARDHWQIYNWNANKSNATVGAVETFLIEDAPQEVVETALKAANAIGDGFYGVDLKYKDGKVYIIEVNDNPSIDRHWEDEILGDKLYIQIMENIMSRIERARQDKSKKIIL